MITVDRRTRVSPDRRRRPTPLLSRYTFVGRRQHHRRCDESSGRYVDRLGAGTWLVILSIFLFQILDAFLTLSHLRHGGTELNPVMEALIESGDWVFVTTKLGLAGVGLLFLGLHKNFPHARRGLAVLFVLFFGVVGWHCFLVANRLLG